MVEADCDANAVKSNLFSLEWPPRSGRTAEFPEIDRAGWFPPQQALLKILRGQKPIVECARELLSRQTFNAG
jgi:predicted NUDIX family NTP pyrophosphohydrolase